ncbi:MAG: DUF1592 domain-containing protein [Opitutaceae bacterium]|jgi:hypothetical protein|nr:DUF1592 domain-containing protein [Opitutaceae bacterium]
MLSPRPFPFALLPLLSLIGASSWAAVSTQEIPESVYGFLDNHCLNCHDSVERKGDFDMETLNFDLTDPHVFETWVKVHDRADHGEMPPKEKRRPEPSELAAFLANMGRPLQSADLTRRHQHGRATVRRLNRFEYENKLRHLLAAPWLQVADDLPEDGTAHLFNKIGDRLDVSHVQMSKYLETAQKTLRTAVNTAAFPAETKKYYMREEPGVYPYIWYRAGLQVSATRAVVPLLGLEPQIGVIRKTQPATVGDSDPAIRELEALGTFSGTYSATTKYDFKRERRPIDGRYRIRVKSYSFLGGLNGASGGGDDGLTGGNIEWWRPNRNFAYRAERSEPVTLYALAASNDSRWLATYDAHPDPTITEHVVDLKAGEGIRPDAARLIRTRPGWDGNANATEAGVPGVAFNWLEVEGPLHDTWPPPCYQTLFGDLPFTVDDDQQVVVQSSNPSADAQRLLWRFLPRASNRPLSDESAIQPYLKIFHQAQAFGESFTEALISAYTTILCSPDFLYLETQPGALENHELAQRLAYFLWNGPPDSTLQNQADLSQSQHLASHVDRLLDDPRSDRFVNAFLDYWLELRDIKLNAPDASLYTDYYLDELLTESAIRETRLFFRELIDQDLPVINLIDSDFTFVNERLALHYGLPATPGVNPQKIALPAGSPRGGLLTQSSVLTVTANGTTTSPVLRGAWIMERIMGLEIPPPPSGIEAVEPDTRGATTIREQIARHIEAAACSTCHEKTDPAGFALESFDVMGGWQDQYRAVDEDVTPVEGIGKNGHAFPFHYAQPVDSSGVLKDGRTFANIKEFKTLLGQEERTIARNLVNRLIVYGTGAPVSFADRAEVEQILDATADSGYGVRSLITAVVQSPLFTIK